MTGPVTRWLRRPVLWKAGYTLGEVLLIAAVVAVGLPVIALCVIALLWRAQ